MLSEASSGTTPFRAAAELASVAADPDRAFETRRRGARWRSRAGLFASPVLTFAPLLVCLRGCLLAIVFVLWIRIAHRDACTTTSPALGARRGGDPGGGRRHGQQCFPCRGSRAEIMAGQHFFLQRSFLDLERRSPLSASPKRGQRRRCAPDIGAAARQGGLDDAGYVAYCALRSRLVSAVRRRRIAPKRNMP